MRHYILVSMQHYMDMYPQENLYVTDMTTDEFISTLKEAIKPASTFVCGYKEPGIDEVFSRMMAIIDEETSHPSPDTDEYLDDLLNTFDDVFENHQRTTDLWDYVRFANKRDEDVDNYLASQGLV